MKPAVQEANTVRPPSLQHACVQHGTVDNSALAFARHMKPPNKTNAKHNRQQTPSGSLDSEKTEDKARGPPKAKPQSTNCQLLLDTRLYFSLTGLDEILGASDGILVGYAIPQYSCTIVIPLPPNRPSMQKLFSEQALSISVSFPVVRVPAPGFIMSLCQKLAETSEESLRIT